MCLTEKMRVLGKLCTSVSRSAFGGEFNVNKSAINIKSDVFKRT